MDERIEEAQNEQKLALEDDIERALDLVRFVSRESNRYSDFIGVATIINMLLLFVGTISRKAEIRYMIGSSAFDAIIIFSAPLALFVTLLLLNRFERVVAIGNAYYQEISDSLEWNETDKRIRLTSRIALKHFVNSATLPFYRGSSNGAAFYLALNFACALLTVLSVVVLSR